jgi:predicted unusual protein kinase regulating ubiquinone biosynthesis (AarF/ABC1/UbiB family)
MRTDGLHGFFHADPHPGNVFVTRGRIAFVDFGMVGTVTPHISHGSAPSCRSRLTPQHG